jgi:hypothetical protein
MCVCTYWELGMSQHVCLHVSRAEWVSSCVGLYQVLSVSAVSVCTYWELSKFLHVLVHIEGCTWFSKCGQVSRAEKLSVLVLVMIQHVLTCIARMLSVYLLASSLFESRVCNFMCLHLPKSSLLLHGMVSIESFACTKCRVGIFVCCNISRAGHVFTCVGVFQGLCLYLHVSACVKCWVCMFIHWGQGSVSTYQELGMYFHVLVLIKSWECKCMWFWERVLHTILSFTETRTVAKV